MLALGFIHSAKEKEEVKNKKSIVRILDFDVNIVVLLTTLYSKKLYFFLYSWFYLCFSDKRSKEIKYDYSKKRYGK